MSTSDQGKWKEEDENSCRQISIPFQSQKFQVKNEFSKIETSLQFHKLFFDYEYFLPNVTHWSSILDWYFWDMVIIKAPMAPPPDSNHPYLPPHHPKLPRPAPSCPNPYRPRPLPHNPSPYRVTHHACQGWC
ncbi:selT-like protein-like isoform 2 [Planoprotostelium fungivorum]|uniref:SelT-like protein-like isoform 2 n=1 Tax=Planoprotostelium fungivorum TaxID=1890364 RepID=A0A2P6MMS2_9EUKA|nr:selT-like protein-like isoform 2 [Planoprotostelium fungivorum]